MKPCSRSQLIRPVCFHFAHNPDAAGYATSGWNLSIWILTCRVDCNFRIDRDQSIHRSRPHLHSSDAELRPRLSCSIHASPATTHGRQTLAVQYGRNSPASEVCFPSRGIVFQPLVKGWLVPSASSRFHWLTWIASNRHLRCMEPMHGDVDSDLLDRPAAMDHPHGNPGPAPRTMAAVQALRLRRRLRRERLPSLPHKPHRRC